MHLVIFFIVKGYVLKMVEARDSWYSLRFGWYSRLVYSWYSVLVKVRVAVIA